MRPSSPNHQAGSGPALLLVPLLVLVLGVLVARSQHRDPSGERPSAPTERAADPVTVWTGSLDLAGGKGQFVAELAALHFDANRQAQDGLALAQAFDLPAGQPWRLRVLLKDAAPRDLDPHGLRLVGEGNSDLKPLVSASGVAHHPLLPLLEPRMRSLGSTPTDVILWGPEPGASVQLEGLLGLDSFELSRTAGAPWQRLGELGLYSVGGHL